MRNIDRTCHPDEDKGVKVLIADDDIEILRTLEFGLRAAGFEVCTATDAWRAFEEAKKGVPDGILLDITMPKGSGLDVLRLLKGTAGTQHIPIIVISGSADPGMPESVKQLGAADYIAKPFEISKVLSTLANHIKP